MRGLVWLVALSLPAPSAAWELTGSVSVEARGFPSSPLDDAQRDASGSIAFAPELYVESENRAHAVTIAPFARLDSGDAERTHWDVREAFWLWAGDAFELRVGLRRVFWGVTESQHLVDIVNQTDLVENLDGEDKLGQPMVDVTWVTDVGVFEGFVLPGFRERTFVGREGRLRGPTPIGEARYESDAAERHLDGALRWTHTLGPWDVGLSHFSGTNREPRFVVDLEPFRRFVPVYDQVDQSGVELQAVFGGWLFKGEFVRRTGGERTFTAATGGFEYTFVGVLESAVDVGVLVEYLVDDRGDRAATPFEDDVFVGSRIALNDVSSTELLIGGLKDRDTGGVLFNVEGSRRFGDRWRGTLELRAFAGAVERDPLFAFRRDDYVQLELSRYF